MDPLETSSSLPWDVLLHVVPFITSQSDLSRFMRTCITLYQHGLPTLSRQCHIRGSSWKSINSFCSFVLKTPDRCLWLRELSIPDIRSYEETPAHELDQEMASLTMLAQAISDARNLECLRIFDFGYLLERASHTTLYLAISSLRNIKAIHFGNLNALSFNLMENMQTTSLKEATLDFDLDPSESLTNVVYLPQHLQQFQDSLEGLIVYDTFQSAPIIWNLGDIAFPRLHTLRIYSDSLENAPMEDLCATFPNAKNVTLLAHQRPMHVLEFRDESWFGWSHHTWKLDRFRCSVPWAYGLGAHFHTQLWDGIVLGDDDLISNLEYFQDVAKDVQVERLDVELHVSNWHRIHHESFTSIFPSLQITHLHLDLRWLEDDVPLGPSAMMLPSVFSDLAVNLEILPLQFLGFRFGVVHQSWSHPGGPGKESLLQLFETHIRHNLDYMSYTHKLANAVPSLKHVCFRFLHLPQSEEVWRAETTNSGDEDRASPRGVVQLDQVEGIRVLKNSPFK
ncbi:hypothetical protein BXZ70DRAFT_384654 [Cristinia sonorae]|uniref:F-box domain-containing protein n=1 Tax=Cristinia sonorae TaxID=1940300 RepID=A0A8K0UL30_9AGAR|nr:hypothetical protein BXZ70DRAFT_384654 [Cristinia sonorae]